MCVAKEFFSNHNWVNDLQFLTRIVKFKKLFIDQSKTKKMYKKVWKFWRNYPVKKQTWSKLSVFPSLWIRLFLFLWRSELTRYCNHLWSSFFFIIAPQSPLSTLLPNWQNWHVVVIFFQCRWVSHQDKVRRHLSLVSAPLGCRKLFLSAYY